ncbi:MAG: 1-deoxy-D-xylulose-5-phosphate reductoisomerase [Eubacteriales bacterium]|nr:1-deoxy-D-xylulose-5-phosphate reductoisomerase [Eubacteriales bacterium]
MKRLAILGSTGSIGTQTLEIVRENPDLQAVALAAGQNAELMEKQIREFRPRIAGMWSEQAAQELRRRTAELPVRIVSGMEGLLEIASMEGSDIVVTAVVGMIGIRPTIAAIESGKTIALANKETLVTAGHIIMPLAAQKGVPILPVDSEHSAIFQSLQGQDRKHLQRILLTASGGPFRGKTRQELEQMTLADALKHPNWSMGKKVTIDSASLVNKGLEVMEARWLFDVSLDQIRVLVHPQSIVHSAVEYADGAVIAQLGLPDMKLPIQYAILYPERRPMRAPRMDLAAIGKLTFEEPDLKTFPGLALAYRAAREGGSMPTVFNAANEMAVKLLLSGKIRFVQIPEILETAMNNHRVIAHPDVEQILETETATYELIEQEMKL